MEKELCPCVGLGSQDNPDPAIACSGSAQTHGGLARKLKVPESPVCLERTGPEAYTTPPSQQQHGVQHRAVFSSERRPVVLDSSPARMAKSGGVELARKRGKGAEWMGQGQPKGMEESGSCLGPHVWGEGGSALPLLHSGSGCHLSARAPYSLQES